MKIKTISLLILLSILTQVVIGQEPDWLKKIKNITLLSSTRDDVIKIFGHPKNENGSSLEYFFVKDGEISVQYSVGKCKTTIIEGKETIQGWNVPDWTVVDIAFSPNKNSKYKKHKHNFTGFKSSPVYDFPNARVYENDELGVRYSINSKGMVELITFYPADKYDYLYCK